MLHKFQTVFLALTLLIASSYCAAECVVGPCHPSQAATQQIQPPPCHQHSQKQQPHHDDETQDCLHSQLVMDSQSAIHIAADLIPAVAIVPVELTLVADIETTVTAAPQSGPPPPWPSLVLATSLRI
jgi:hypothetical protein